MDGYYLDQQQKIHICSSQPDAGKPECPGYVMEQGDFSAAFVQGASADAENSSIECDKCTDRMVLKTGRFGHYFACNACDNTRKMLANGQPAPPKMTPIPMPHLRCNKVNDHYVLRDGASGLFLAASKFPKNRETRSPMLSEIHPCKEQIPEKYHFLFAGPMQDEHKHPTEVRFSRKSGQHYLMTVKDGKPTGWRAEYTDGKWQIKKRGKKA